MTTSTAVAGNTPRVPYTDHSRDYIPQTSPWNEQRICDYVPAENMAAQKTCCSGVKTIDRAIDKAYRHGVQAHLGIAAIQDYPCVTQAEMSRLSNDLERVIKQHGIKMEMPQGINPMERPLAASKEVMNYCKEVVFEKLARELGRVQDSKPLAFSKHIVKYCQYALTLRPSNLTPSLHRNERWD